MVQVRVLLVFAACVLQNAHITAVPDFGVAVSIDGSVAVQDAAVRIGRRFQELSANLDFALGSPYEKLGLLKDQFTYLAHNLTSIGTAFATALNTATTSSGNVAATFEPAIVALSHLQAFETNAIEGIIAEIDSIVGQPVRAQLEDSFGTIDSAVGNLFGALLQLVATIQTTTDPANKDVAVVSHLNRTVNVLRANLLPLNYTIGTTGENIRVADAFLSRLTAGSQLGATTVVNEVRLFQTQVGLLANATLQVASCVQVQVGGFETMAEPFLQTLCDCRTACPLQLAVQSVAELTTTEFDRVVRLVRQRFNDLAAYSSFLEELGESFSVIYALGLQLADVTIIMRPYSMYCYHMFAQLVEQLIPRLSDGIVDCFHEELTRLRSLQTSLDSMFQTFVFDVEDLVAQLELCTFVLDQSDCAAEVVLLYRRLAKQMEEKLEVIEEYSLAETSASYDRLQVCAFQTSVTVVYANTDQLTYDIEICAEYGPYDGLVTKKI